MQAKPPDYSANGQASGTLFIVATPIGNLEDITYRAVSVLNSVNAILAEDTRHSRKLLVQYGIHKPIIGLHEHNEHALCPIIIDRLHSGQSLALVSDAGTPLINDPGYLLVQHALEAELKVVPIPGPCALITALCAAGIPTYRFTFEGFLPAKAQAREKIIATWRNESRTIICYEATHRILPCLEALQNSLGAQRKIVVARELTKAFETFYRGSLSTVTRTIQNDVHAIKGEFVLLIEGNRTLDDQASLQSTVPVNTDWLLKTLLSELPRSQAVRLAQTITGMRKNALYQYTLSAQSEETT